MKMDQSQIVSTAAKPTSCKRKLFSVYNEESSDDDDGDDDDDDGVDESEDAHDLKNDADFVPIQGFSASRKTNETVPE